MSSSMDLPKACTEYATQLFTYPPNDIVDFGKFMLKTNVTIIPLC